MKRCGHHSGRVVVCMADTPCMKYAGCVGGCCAPVKGFGRTCTEAGPGSQTFGTVCLCSPRDTGQLDIYLGREAMDDQTKSLLEARHTAVLQWYEPWPACGPDGCELGAHITLRATVHDCINIQRRVDLESGRTVDGDDMRRLGEFMTVFWAHPAPSDGRKETPKALGHMKRSSNEHHMERQ